MVSWRIWSFLLIAALVLGALGQEQDNPVLYRTVLQAVHQSTDNDRDRCITVGVDLNPIDIEQLQLRTQFIHVDSDSLLLLTALMKTAWCTRLCKTLIPLYLSN